MNRSTFLNSGLAFSGAVVLSSCSAQPGHPAIDTTPPQKLRLIRPNILSADFDVSAKLRDLKIEGYQDSGSSDLFWSRYAVTRPPALIAPNNISTALPSSYKPNIVISGGGGNYSTFSYGWDNGDGSYGDGYTYSFPTSGNSSGHAYFYDGSGSYSGPTFWQAATKCAGQATGLLGAASSALGVILGNASTYGPKITNIGAKYAAVGATAARAAAFIFEVFALATATQWLLIAGAVFGLISLGIFLAECIGTQTSYRQSSLRFA